MMELKVAICKAERIKASVGEQKSSQKSEKLKFIFNQAYVNGATLFIIGTKLDDVGPTNFYKWCKNMFSHIYFFEIIIYMHAPSLYSLSLHTYMIHDTYHAYKYNGTELLQTKGPLSSRQIYTF